MQKKSINTNLFVKNVQINFWKTKVNIYNNLLEHKSVTIVTK